MDDDNLSVFGSTHVELDVSGAVFDGLLKGDEGILGRLPRSASVADDPGFLAVKERIKG